MAKERPEKAEETEQMIEKEAAKEAAEEAAAAAVGAVDGRDMRAVLLSGFGGLNKLRVARKVMAEPQEGELKIRVKAWYPFSILLPQPPQSRTTSTSHALQADVLRLAGTCSSSVYGSVFWNLSRGQTWKG